MAASAAMGWMTPVSLLANMTLTSFVLGRMAASKAAGSMTPCGVVGRKVTSTFLLARDSAARRMASCSMLVVMRWAGSVVCSRVPKRARLSLSVPPEVKTISEVRQEAGDAVASVVNGCAGKLALLVDRAGVAVVLEKERAHGLEDFGEQRRGGVGVHVDSAHGSILLR